VLMLLLASLHNLSRTIGTALLFVVSSDMTVIVLLSEMASYHFAKFLRRDYVVWVVGLEGGLKYGVAFFTHTVVKVNEARDESREIAKTTNIVYSIRRCSWTSPATFTAEDPSSQVVRCSRCSLFTRRRSPLELLCCTSIKDRTGKLTTFSTKAI